MKAEGDITTPCPAVSKPNHEPLAQFFDDMAAAAWTHRKRDYQKAAVDSQMAVLVMLKAYGKRVSPERAEQLSELAFFYRQLATIFVEMSEEQVKSLFRHRVIRREQRAVAAAAVELLMRRRWSRSDAGKRIGQAVGVGWKKAVGWRDTLLRHPPVFIADLNAEAAAHRGTTRLHQRTDVAAFNELLRIASGDDEAALLERIDNLLVNLDVKSNLEKIDAEFRAAPEDCSAVSTCAPE
jgi:hypothetical protein